MLILDRNGLEMPNLAGLPFFSQLRETTRLGLSIGTLMASSCTYICNVRIDLLVSSPAAVGQHLRLVLAVLGPCRINNSEAKTSTGLVERW